MKIHLVYLSVMLGLLVSLGSASAQTTRPDPQAREQAREQLRQNMAAQGIEPQALSESFQAALIKEFDKEGNGELSPAERRIAMLSIRQYMMEGMEMRARGNASREVSQEERQARRDEMRNRREAQTGKKD